MWAVYQAIDRSVESREAREAVQDVIDQLHDLTVGVNESCAVLFHAHLMIADVVGAHTHRTNTEQVGEILFHLAEAARIGVECDEVSLASTQIARSSHGIWSSQIAEQLDPDEAASVMAESERTLRDVYGTAGEGTTEQVGRACNLAARLLAEGEPSATAEATELLLAQADRLHLLGPDGETDYLRQLGHAYRRTAQHADTSVEAAAYRKLAIDLYRQVESRTPPSHSTTLYADIAILMSESGDGLDEVIEVARTGIERMDESDPYHREASMQLAEFHIERYRRDRHPADADHAEAHSFEAVRSYYTRPGSFEQQGLLHRRLKVLEATANRTGNRLDRYDEMLEIAVRTGHDMSAPGLAAFAGAAEATRSLVLYSRKDIDLQDLIDALTSHLTFSRFDGVSTDRGARTAGAVELVADAIDRIQFSGDDISQAGSLIQSAHNAAAQAAGELDAARLMDEFSIAQARGRLALSEACALGRRDVLAQAASLLDHAVSVGGRQDLAPSQMLPVLSLALRAAFITNDQAAISRFCAELLATVADLDRAMAKNSTPESSVLRERLVAPEIGPIALSGQTPQEIAWRMASLRDPRDVCRSTWVANVEKASETATLVFMAQSLQRCLSVVLSDGEWHIVDMDEAAAQHFVPVLRSLAEASESEVDVDERRILLEGVMEHTKAKLSALTANMPVDRPLLLMDSGLLHWLPIETALLALLPSHPGIARVDRPTTSMTLGHPHSLESTAILLAPGVELVGGPAYLPGAFGNADALRDAIAESEVYFEPDLADTADIIDRSNTAFFVAHGEAEIRSPLDSRINLGQPFTARDAWNLSGDPLQLAVLATCESLGFDGDVVEAQFGIGTSLLRSGTNAVVECAWRVTDTVAAQFTLAFAVSLIDGQSVEGSFATAVRSVPYAADHFRLRFSGIPTQAPRVLTNPRQRCTDQHVDDS